MRTRMAATGARAAALALLLCGALLAAGPRPPAEAAIRAQVEKINLAWKSDAGVEIIRPVLSDAYCAAIPHPREPGAWITLDKEGFCNAFGRMLRENRPRKHVRQTTRVTVRGGIAFENGLSVHVTDTGTKTDRILNVWRLEGDTWRLLLSSYVADVEEAMKGP
ncbi:MAG: hypothetical protein JXR77_02985 [Lentisphaeria bacterium]|nr:hypothetical protein [Lentisphaeria bacterium]